MVRFIAIIFCFSLFVLLLSPQEGQAQDKCGTVALDVIRHQKNPSMETTDQFEQWMAKKLFQKKNISAEVAASTQAASYNIPVVVHIIHNGEAVGSGANLSDAQVASQIQVLNEDFKRLNSDASSTPAEFQPVAGSIQINFILAKQDPEGRATNGITRTQGAKTSYDLLLDNYELKALSYWPAEDYFNIWVVVSSTSSSIIGLTQLPVSSQLSGLEESSIDRLTDGVTISSKTFGKGASFSLSASYNLGRTATHEVGHFFGLRHIWGDSNCGTDYCDDTPAQTTSTTGCPSYPQASCDTSAHPNKMFENYMDYSNDNCMNLFTKNQNSRMDIILNNSPRRLSLWTSHGLNDPTIASVDLGIKQIVNPTATICDPTVTPQLEIRNHGATTITSAKIQMSVGGSPVGSPIAFPLSLAPDQFTTVSFSALTFTPSSSQNVSFQITETNGAADDVTSNNSASVQVIVPASISLPVSEPFNSVPAGWQILNPDGRTTWQNIQAPAASASNQAMYVNFYDYDVEGEIDELISPSFTTATPLASQLRFDVSHATYPGQTGDGLRVYALPSCSTDLSTAILLYDKSGTTLATTTATSSSFTPTAASQWRNEVVSLSGLSSTTHYQIAFVSVNGWGNNLYLDNVTITDSNINDIALTGIASPGLVECQASPQINFNVKNLSSVPITSFQLQQTLNNGTTVNTSFSNFTLAVGEERAFSFTSTLKSGVNQIALVITNPNGLADTAPANNTLTFNTYFDQSADASPLRQTFDSKLEVPWIIASPFNATAWQSTSTTKNTSLVFKSFSNSVLGQQSWVASPVLDLSRYNQHSLFFDLSYALNPDTQADNLKIIASDDCGLTYNYTLYDKSGTDLSVTTSSSEWVPGADSQWKREYVNLDELSGKQNIRLAFVATNEHGNNIYIDNIEIFAGTDQDPPIATSSYQIYYSTHTSESDLALTFNLAQKQDVHLQIYSLQGQIVADNILPDALNQTFYFDFGAQAAGIYLFRLQIDNQASTTKVFIRH